MIQRDGDVVGTDGTSPLGFPVPAGNYHIALRHRNHLGCMSAAPVALSSGPAVIDLTQPTTATWGTNAQRTVNGRTALWSGDLVKDGVLKYTGTGNDRDVLLQAIGGIVPTNTVSGYLPVDANMNSVANYTGADNDRDRILYNIGGVVPSNVVIEQLP